MSVKVRIVAVAVLASCLAPACSDGQGSPAGERVDSAFERGRQGDYQAIRELATLDASNVPRVAKYLGDPVQVLRVEALGVLEAFNACGEITSALTNSSAEIRERAAASFFRACGIAAVDAGVALALRESLQMGNGSAASLLLLGASGDARSAAILRERSAGKGLVKWAMDSQPVPEALAAKVALFRAGDAGVRPSLVKSLANPDPAVARFFLDAIAFIQDREALELLSRRLEDTRLLLNERRRRICDYAVPAFARRFHLKLSFEIRDFGPYDERQRKEVRAAVNTEIARMGGAIQERRPSPE